MYVVLKTGNENKWNFRRCSQIFFQIGILKNFAIFTPVSEPFFNRDTCLKVCNFIKKRLQYRWFPVNIAKLVRTPLYRIPPMAASQTFTINFLSCTPRNSILTNNFVEDSKKEVFDVNERSCCSQMFFKISIFKNFTIFS